MMTTASASRNAALVVLRRTWARTTVTRDVFPASIRSFSSNNNNNNNGGSNNNNMMTRPRRPSPRMGRSQQQQSQNQQQQQQNRLRRPNPSSMDNSATENITAPSPSSQFGLRHNAITILPGDFSDSYDSQWKDDDDDDWQEDDGDDDDNDVDDVWSPEVSPDGSNNNDNDDDDDGTSFGAMDSLTRAFAEKAQTDQANRERWIANAEPPVLHSIVDERGRAYGRGGRKAATARAWIQAGCGQVVVNRLDFINYFIRPFDREHVLQPLVATDTVGLWDVQIMVRGGGLTGQAGAARLALANALNAYNPQVFRPPLKKLGLLTRDSRIVERKKVGHKKARKSPQWVRR